jgi:hypothetical protein
MDSDEYCREIEAYLCRKNDGHLIRIVGPSFDRVTGWAERGVPIKIACRGIDRYFERYYARGPRRRPVLIDFCEPDVLDAFDEWRRAIGMLQSTGPADAPEPGDGPGPIADAGRGDVVRARHRTSLAAHLERVILKLTSLRRSGSLTAGFDAALERAVRELDLARQPAKSLRGEARARLVERLRALDGELLAVARAACGPERVATLRSDAADELGPFRERMTEAAYEQAVQAAVDRLVRDLVGLPELAVE